MKWGIIVLLFLGLVAGLSAAVLVGAIKLDFFSRGNKAPQTVTVVVAAKDLPSATIITSECIEKKTLPLAELPVEKRAQRLASETGSIDRVLGIGVVKGTILTEVSFLPRGSAEELMAKIPPGMRAFTVRLSSGPDPALLRPGSIVDVYSITTMKGVGRIASPLLNGIMVLAVQGETIISNQTEEKSASRRRSGAMNVTLQVNSEQARALQLAMSGGAIAVSLRNPRDKLTPSMDPITLDDGGRYIPVRPEDLLMSEQQNGGVSTPGSDPNETKENASSYGPVVPVPKVSPPTDNPTPRNTSRKVIIHRGNKTEEETLEEPRNEDDNAADKASSFDSERRVNEIKRTVNKITC